MPNKPLIDITAKQNGKAIELCIFDFDGTLFLTDKANWKSYQYVLKKHGFELDYETFKTRCDGLDYRTFLGLVFDIIDEQLLNDIHNAKKKLYPNFYKFIEPDMIVLQTAQQLHLSCKTAIVTTASRESVMDILEMFNCADYFDFIIAKEDVANQKPSPEGYLKAMIKSGASPSTTMIFEDSKSGLQAANLSGASVIKVVRKEEITSFQIGG